jgi:hypothetical protein
MAATSGELTSTTTIMASQGDQSQAVQVSNQPIRSRRRKHRAGYKMLECKDPPSSPNSLMYQSHFLKKTFSSRITLTMTPWSYHVLSKSSWFTMSSLTRVVHVAEPPKLFQLKCLSHVSRAATHLNRNNPSVTQI